MPRKNTITEVTEFLSTRYCYMYLLYHPNAPTINFVVMAQDDKTAEFLINQYTITRGATWVLIARAATIVFK